MKNAVYVFFALLLTSTASAVPLNLSPPIDHLTIMNVPIELAGLQLTSALPQMSLATDNHGHMASGDVLMGAVFPLPPIGITLPTGFGMGPLPFQPAPFLAVNLISSGEYLSIDLDQFWFNSVAGQLEFTGLLTTLFPPVPVPGSVLDVLSPGLVGVIISSPGFIPTDLLGNFTTTSATVQIFNVPVPPALPLFMIGLVGLLLGSRRKSKI